MSKSDDVAILVSEHSYAMLKTLQLPKNMVKPHWNTQTLDDLFFLLEKEVDELRMALLDYCEYGGPADHVRSEASDVSNFAAMIADRCKS